MPLPQLLRGLPTDNIISFFCVHSLCSTGLDVLHELLRRGVNLNQQVWQDPHSGQRGPVDDGVQIDWKKEFVSLFASTQHLPAYFDCCFAWHVGTSMSNGFFDDEDVVNAQSQVTLLMSNGGRPGPALREVARSGMLAEAIKQLSWPKLGFPS